MTVRMFLEQLEKAKLLRFGKGLKEFILASPTVSAAPHSYWSSAKFI